MLGHTSGLPDAVVNPVAGTWLGETAEEALAELAKMPLQAQPGEAWSYNQTNYMLLGLIVEKVAGVPFETFLARNILEPLEPAAFVYGDSRVVVPNRGSWYSMIDFSSGRPRRAAAIYPTSVIYPSFIHTAAGLNSTALDLARFADGIAHGKILGKATVDSMWTAVSLIDGTTFRMEKTLGVGLGWIVDDVPGHRSAGGTGGSSVAFRHYRDDDLTVVVLTNLQGIDPDALCDAIAGLYFGG
ncbi:MAG: serine hydrolase domain-containing protein [Gemmatimonadaceae bacterium]